MKNINKLIDDSLVELTKHQIQMLELSDEDIKAGRLIPHEKVNEGDLKWLNEIEQKNS